jgi:class I fructose-bisphosphate aldolase
MRARLNRLFGADGRCFDVAVDHGFFGEPAFLTGIEDMRRAVDVVVRAAPDAVQLAPGQAHWLQDIQGPDKPALVLRTDVANVYGPNVAGEGQYLFSQLVDRAVEQAVLLDAACVVVNLLLLPNHDELYHACLRNVCALRTACTQVGMPLMVEPLAMQVGHAGYGVNGDAATITTLVRQAVELGADIIKADPTERTDDYGAVVQAALGHPVLIRGGGRASDAQILERTEALMAQGVAGIVYGRNVIQHRSPAAMTRALMAVVHDGASAATALAMIEAENGDRDG